MKIKNTLAIVATATILAGCSQISQSIPSSMQSITKLGGQFGSQEKSYEDSQQSSLVVPPSLALPSGVSRTNNYQASNNQVTNLGSRNSRGFQSNSNNNFRQQPQMQQPQQQRSRTSGNAPTRALSSNKNYYVVVGTYPDSEQAMDTFVRLSSIGLPNATMESRATKSGKSLHMVRLGPFKRQAQIDKIKESLMSDGLTQFKVVES